EVNPQFANIVSPSEVVVVSSFQLELEGGSGEMQITMPYSMVEPIRELLDAGIQSDTSERDERWARSLQGDIRSAELVLEAELTRIRMTMRELMQLKPGDVIPFEMPAEVCATSEGIPIFTARFGASRGNLALQVVAPYRHEVQPPRLADLPAEKESSDE
ncbi:MAG: flagellar motor switch protein FliM, partial [Gammaproteobacteria bacterium]